LQKGSSDCKVSRIPDRGTLCVQRIGPGAALLEIIKRRARVREACNCSPLLLWRSHNYEVFFPSSTQHISFQSVSGGISSAVAQCIFHNRLQRKEGGGCCPSSCVKASHATSTESDRSAGNRCWNYKVRVTVR